jgi:pantoate--beta-alanine ligase
MGCLHQGHLELVRLAQTQADKVAVSIFVNPLQFGPNEDFHQYPRTLENDKQLLSELNVDFLFTPDNSDLYPNDFTSRVQVGPIGKRLCGEFRPGHFDGVATICLKLFQITQADAAVFGEKDFQQLQVIRNLVRDFNLPLSILPHQTVREEDGLALSSRNRYLSEVERQQAACIPLALKSALLFLQKHPQSTVNELLMATRDVLSQLEIQYLEITHHTQLESAPKETLVAQLIQPRLFLAAKCGTTRLIDNISLSQKDFRR